MIALSDTTLALTHGATLGIAVAAPIGPTEALCIQRTLLGGARVGLATGYGAATIHMLFASIAVLGLPAVSNAVATWAPFLKVACAAFLIHMAVQTVRCRPAPASAAAGRLRSWRAYVTGLTWTLSNPVTLVGFMMLTPGIVGTELAGSVSWVPVAVGVLVGSAAWWTALATVVAYARDRLSIHSLRVANTVIGMALMCFAIAILIDVTQRQGFR